MWRQPEGLGSSKPQVGEWSTTAKGIWEEVWAHRRSKVPLLGRGREGGEDHIGIALPVYTQTLR